MRQTSELESRADTFWKRRVGVGKGVAAAALLLTAVSCTSAKTSGQAPPPKSASLEGVNMRCLSHDDIMIQLLQTSPPAVFNYTPQSPTGAHGNLLFLQDVQEQATPDNYTDTFLFQAPGISIENAALQPPFNVYAVWIDLGSAAIADVNLQQLKAEFEDTSSDVYHQLTECTPLAVGQ